jgi:membrane-associated protease RseP (regulator of RpoE activity)
VIVVATADFELYHEVVALLRDRGVAFTTVEAGDDLPEEASVVIAAPDDDAVGDGETERVTATAADARRAVDEALALLRGGGGRTVVGVDPGIRPGIAVLAGETVVAAFQVPLGDAVETIRREVADAVDPLVRIGDGARLQGARLVNDLDDVTVELVDETGTTPYLGTGARGMGDVLAAVNIARLEGERVDSREVDPTAGELQRIKDRSRQVSSDDRTIDEGLARRVAAGDLTVEEALDEHRD